jgi:hypothetical protein
MQSALTSNDMWTRGFQFKVLHKKFGWKSTDAIFGKLVVFRQIAKVTSDSSYTSAITCAHVGRHKKLLQPLVKQQKYPAPDGHKEEELNSAPGPTGSHPCFTARQGVLRGQLSDVQSLSLQDGQPSLHSKEGKSASTWIPGIPQSHEGSNLLHDRGCITASPPVWMLEMQKQMREMFRLVLEVSNSTALGRLRTPCVAKMSIYVTFEMVKLLAAVEQFKVCVQGLHLRG